MWNKPLTWITNVSQGPSKCTEYRWSYLAFQHVPNVIPWCCFTYSTIPEWRKHSDNTQVGTGVDQFFSRQYLGVTIMKVRVFGREIHTDPDHHLNVKEHAAITIMSNLSSNQSWMSFCGGWVLRCIESNTLDYSRGRWWYAILIVSAIPRYLSPSWLDKVIVVAVTILTQYVWYTVSCSGGCLLPLHSLRSMQFLSE